VPDHKPPRLAADERETLVALLQFQRESMVRKVEGVDEEAARHSIVPTGTSLLGLVKHLRAAEVTWVLRRFAGQDVPIADGALEDGTVAEAVAAYQATWAAADAVVAAASSLDEPCRGLDDDQPTNLRWVLAHLLEETARHAGHADILRELIDGETGR
jgi:hypothetical protein